MRNLRVGKKKDGKKKDAEAAARAVLHNIFACTAKSIHVRIEVKEAGGATNVASPLLSHFAEIDVIGLETDKMWAFSLGISATQRCSLTRRGCRRARGERSEDTVLGRTESRSGRRRDGRGLAAEGQWPTS